MIASWRRTVIFVPGDGAETEQARAFLQRRGVKFEEVQVPQTGAPRLWVSGMPFNGLDEIRHGVSYYGL